MGNKETGPSLEVHPGLPSAAPLEQRVCEKPVSFVMELSPMKAVPTVRHPNTSPPLPLLEWDFHPGLLNMLQFGIQQVKIDCETAARAFRN